MLVVLGTGASWFPFLPSHQVSGWAGGYNQIPIAANISLCSHLGDRRRKRLSLAAVVVSIMSGFESRQSAKSPNHRINKTVMTKKEFQKRAFALGYTVRYSGRNKKWYSKRTHRPSAEALRRILAA